ncbi:DUF6804 family protein [Xylanibacter caecicola]|uniref:DUF6804 family protein n=1 Tax=Xylanibacter caecicola TaxID=2736294 RepID=UPI003336C472
MSLRKRKQREIKEDKKIAVTFAALALLFQPFMKISLGRTIWNAVDVAIAILLIILWLKDNIQKNS